MNEPGATRIRRAPLELINSLSFIFGVVTLFAVAVLRLSSTTGQCRFGVATLASAWESQHNHRLATVATTVGVLRQIRSKLAVSS
jgi:hypothetical protein